MPTPSGDNKPRFHTLIPAATARTNRPRSSVAVSKPANHAVKSTKKISSTTTQTDATAYPKAGSSFQTSPRQDESGMRQDYTRAVNFINSCHKFVNSLIEIRGDASTGDKNKFFLPKVTNFVPLFSWLIGGEQQQQQPVAPAKDEQPKRTRHRKKPVDGGASQIEKDLKDMLQGHLGEFLNNIQSNLTTIVTDTTKAKVEKDVSKTKARMVTTIQSFEYRGKSQTRHEYPALPPPSPPSSVLVPLPPPEDQIENSQFPNFTEETAVESFNSAAMLCGNSSSSSCSLSHSQLSDSSDIKSDADIRDELIDC